MSINCISFVDCPVNNFIPVVVDPFPNLSTFENDGVCNYFHNGVFLHQVGSCTHGGASQTPSTLKCINVVINPGVKRAAGFTDVRCETVTTSE